MTTNMLFGIPVGSATVNPDDKVVTKSVDMSWQGVYARRFLSKAGMNALLPTGTNRLGHSSNPNGFSFFKPADLMYNAT
jgi:hypothetical protein